MAIASKRAQGVVELCTGLARRRGLHGGAAQQGLDRQLQDLVQLATAVLLLCIIFVQIGHWRPRRGGGGGVLYFTCARPAVLMDVGVA